MKRNKNKGSNTVSLTRKRTVIISIVFLLFTSVLLSNLFNLQVLSYDHYKDKVYDQITTTSKLTAKRGNIYDRNMTVLATTKTEWRVFISTRDIKTAEKESGKAYTEIISDGLSSILDISRDFLYNKIKNTNVLDVTIKKGVPEDEYENVLAFVQKNSLERLVFTEAQSSRYYPEQTFAAHTIGFTGSDNQGLYGLEYYYDSILKGKDGYYLYAKDANGNALDTEYSSYIPEEDGNSIVTTIDSYIQSKLESQLESILINHAVNNRVTGVVMNTETGAILGMATSSPFNPNDPYKLDEISEKKLKNSGYAEESDEYKKLRRELMEIMWSNKAISETYEPGSTFKIITVASALDCGAASLTDRFSCIGFYEVGGWHIKCHKVTGHGSNFTLGYGLQMSCNPTMMQTVERIGSQRLYNYIEQFGYFEKSGIDLPSEARTIFHKPENIGSTELATISFGQRFKVSVINHLRAVSAIANDGNLVTPHLLDKVIDKNGKTVFTYENNVTRNVVSKEVANSVASVLEEGVSGDGGAKNARVDGYKVAAKTGTSQKFDILDSNGNSYLRIGSTVAFAPSDSSGIAVIIVVDEPTTSVKYGSVVAAPYVSALLTDILPYLEYRSTEEKTSTVINNYIGLPIAEAEKTLKESKISYEIIGNGETVISQVPSAGDIITSALSKVLIYTEPTAEYIKVPNLIGKSIDEAAKTALEAGLNLKISGSITGGFVISQSLPFDVIVKRGEVIELVTLVTDYED